MVHETEQEYNRFWGGGQEKSRNLLGMGRGGAFAHAIYLFGS